MQSAGMLTWSAGMLMQSAGMLIVGSWDADAEC